MTPANAHGRRLSTASILLIALAALPWAAARGEPPRRSTLDHLMEGVRAFREARFAEALVEFRVVERAPDAPPELAYYLGPTLYKLGRYREALQVFVASEAPRDALTDYYLGTTLYQLRLYRQAREVFSQLAVEGLGPRLREAAQRYTADIDRLYAAPPAAAVVEAYAAEVRPALSKGEVLVAAKLLEEALKVAALLPRPVVSPTLADATAAISRSAGSYLAVGDRARARPLYTALSQAPGADGAKARQILRGTLR